MDQRAAADAYRRASIENAPPIKIVRMLYQGALRFLQQAESVDPSDPSSPFVDLLERVDAIVIELRLSIDHSAGADMTADLERLYLFCEDLWRFFSNAWKTFCLTWTMPPRGRLSRPT